MIMGIIFSYVLAYLALVEIAKRIFYRHHNDNLRKINSETGSAGIAIA